MRLLTIICVLSYCLCVSSQHRLTNTLNVPRFGDEIIKQQVEYKDPGRSGENVLWDFGKLNSLNDEYRLFYVCGKDSLLVGIEHQTMYYYSLSGDSLLCHGFENPTTVMKNERPELLLTYPVNYGDSILSYYNGNGKYCERLKISAMGTVSSKSDAFGMMILPDKDTLKNVIRVRTVKTIAERSEELFDAMYRDSIPSFVSSDSIEYRLRNDSVLLEIETYRWYAKGYRYPVFETIKSSTNRQDEERKFFDVAFFYPPQEHYYLDSDPENLAELFDDDGADPENEQPGITPDLRGSFTYNFYPNPVSNILTLEYYLAETADLNIRILDMNGINLHDRFVQGQTAGVYTFRIDMSEYAKGSYLLNIATGDQIFTDIILKK